jgi:hypothetical protein
MQGRMDVSEYAIAMLKEVFRGRNSQVTFNRDALEGEFATLMMAARLHNLLLYKAVDEDLKTLLKGVPIVLLVMIMR